MRDIRTGEQVVSPIVRHSGDMSDDDSDQIPDIFNRFFLQGGIATTLTPVLSRYFGANFSRISAANYRLYDV